MRSRFFQRIIDKLRGKAVSGVYIRIHGDNSKIKNGGNEIKFEKLSNNSSLKVNIFGENNKIIINSSDEYYFDICIGTPDCSINNCTVYIGKNVVTAGKVLMFMTEDNQEIYIDDNCMFSSDIDIWASDTHTIFAMEGKVVNKGKGVKIGKHCWICTKVSILKNTEISDNSVVGLGSVVSGKFLESNCVIAGNPARVVKRGINWDRKRIKQYEAGIDNCNQVGYN